MVSSKVVRQAIYQKLNVAAITTQLPNGSASLHHSVAPSSATYPLVIFNEQASTSTTLFGGDQMDSQVWLVKAIVKGGSSTAEDVDKAIADVLHFQPLNITGAEDLYLARESAVTYTETISGENYRHHGHTYRLVLQDSP